MWERGQCSGYPLISPLRLYRLTQLDQSWRNPGMDEDYLVVVLSLTHTSTNTPSHKINRSKRNVTLKTDCFQATCRRRENSFLIESTPTAAPLSHALYAYTLRSVCRVSVEWLGKAQGKRGWRKWSIKTIRHHLMSLKPKTAPRKAQVCFWCSHASSSHNSLLFCTLLMSQIYSVIDLSLNKKICLVLIYA